MGFDKNLLIESVQNRLQNEVSTLFCCPYLVVVLGYHDTVWLCRQQLPIIYSWTIGFAQPVVILELSFKNLW
jgi:hypothetical protein